MIGRTCLAAVALCWLCLPASAAADETIIWATDGLYPPFSDVGDKGEPIGLDHAIALAVCAQLERSCRFVVTPWSELFTGLRDGHFDVLYSGLSEWTVEAEGAASSAPYFSTAGRFVAESDRVQSMTIKTGDAVIGVLAGTPHAVFLETAINTPKRLRRYPDKEEMYLSLLSGGVDAVFGDGLLLYHDVVQQGRELPLIFVPPAVEDEAFFGNGLVFALRDDDVLTAAIDRALETLKQKGDLNSIIETHLPGYTVSTGP